MSFKTGAIGDWNTKQAYMNALRPLCDCGGGKKQPPFIYRPPGFVLDNDGHKIMSEPPRDPYHSPYIINVFKFLWFDKKRARWSIPTDDITLPQLAFVCTLV
jgi:hypothetical protein